MPGRMCQSRRLRGRLNIVRNSTHADKYWGHRPGDLNAEGGCLRLNGQPSGAALSPTTCSDPIDRIHQRVSFLRKLGATHEWIPPIELKNDVKSAQMDQRHRPSNLKARHHKQYPPHIRTIGNPQIMRHSRIKADLPTPQHEALAFFSLSLTEQLFDLTDDSFKAPAFNTFTRTLELQSVASANHAAGIAKEALVPFVEELEWSVAKDPVLDSQQRELCKLHIASIRENLGEPDRIARGVSGLRTVLGEYFSDIKNRIRETIAVRPTRKQDLAALAAIFVVQAEAVGFPRRHTYHVTQNSLIRRLKADDAFDPTTRLNDFFSRFPKERTKYSCLFLSDGEFERFPTLLKIFSISATLNPPTWEGITADQQGFISSKKPDQHFILIDGIEAKSPVKAHQVAANVFGEFAGLVRFFEHRQAYGATSLSLVRDESSARIYRIHDAPDPMHCWVTHTLADEREMLEFATATHGTRFHDISANKLRRAIRLHHSALVSGEAENQLIDLWAALEGLVSRPGRESQRLQYFSECILPALTLTYPEKIFLSVYRDLSQVAPGAHELLLKLEGQDSGFSKFVRIILCAEHEKLRGKFIEELKSHPLLLNKAWRLSENFKNRTAVQQTLRKHRQKVSWHLARIYHMRNSIMHSAKALPSLPTLVENLHVYIDTLIKALQKTAMLSPERLSIDGALQYLSVWERYRLHSITHEAARKNDAAPTDNDVWSIVFGDRLALAPKQEQEPALP
ncbi:hypothetical protein SDC9_89057 [bioreactor metagenome]|uniref:Apea-like HEPN domain-containing protein n=1 Tax=bioreactor metagenome TaxID=1076179 RepID=A0A644ZNH2_9ZZZZ